MNPSRSDCEVKVPLSLWERVGVRGIATDVPFSVPLSLWERVGVRGIATDVPFSVPLSLWERVGVRGIATDVPFSVPLSLWERVGVRGIATDVPFSVPLSLWEKAGARGNRENPGLQSSRPAHTSPHPDPLPKGEGDLAGNRPLAAFLVLAALILAAAPAGGSSPETSPLEASAANPPAAVLQAESQRIAVMARVRPAVAAIFAAGGQGGGSGALISADGYALTNFHVAQPCGNTMKCGLADGRVYDAVLVGLDPTGDIALVQLLGRNDFPHVELGDSDLLRAGDWVFAMGNPFLLAFDFQPTVTYGIVSATHRYQPPAGTLLEYADCIQTDASINPGNSGGPLFDMEGRLVGVNGRCSFQKRGRVSVGVGYAVSVNQIKNFLGCLRSGRIVDHASLGARVGSDEDGRVVVTDVLEDSDAYRRGLRVDDELIAFGGRPVTTPNGFKNALGIFPKGWRVPLSFRREGKRFDVSVRLAGLHRGEELLEKISARPPTPPLPAPKPNERPRSERKKGGPNDRPAPLKLPIPEIPLPEGLWKLFQPPDNSMPEIVRRRFEPKRGYANYFYNKLNQDRVFRAWAAKSDFAGLDGSWTIAGAANGGRKYAFELSDAGGAMRLPGGEVKWEAGATLGASLLPAGSGGLLPALYLWRRLALLGPERFGQVEYQGLAPLRGRQDLVDVLVGSHKGVECWFYFDPAGGELLALEMYPAENVDPCEIYFSDDRGDDGRLLPGRIEVRVSDELFGVFAIERFAFAKGGKK